MMLVHTHTHTLLVLSDTSKKNSFSLLLPLITGACVKSCLLSVKVNQQRHLLRWRPHILCPSLSHTPIGQSLASTDSWRRSKSVLQQHRTKHLISRFLCWGLRGLRGNLLHCVSVQNPAGFSYFCLLFCHVTAQCRDLICLVFIFLHISDTGIILHGDGEIKSNSSRSFSSSWS